MVIINKVHFFRKNKKLTQEELAKMVGVSRKTIVSLEKGNYTPSLLLAFQIAKALDMDLTEIFFLGENGE
ncbi:helix-turn-helix transcriptional regulator [Enterococcus sp. AZ173]|uniref:helix-turn-helix transcriptional regulator n=1 Tax=Enterococcus sp. AZ173 TaxID=2774700 RepID=UPI003D269686